MNMKCNKEKTVVKTRNVDNVAYVLPNRDSEGDDNTSQPNSIELDVLAESEEVTSIENANNNFYSEMSI